MNIATALFYFSILLSGAFLVRVVLALCSRESAKRFREQALLNTIWFLIIPIFCIVYLPLLFSYGPPSWWERRAQRQKVLERIQAAGGWDALKHDCVALAEHHKSEPAWQWYAGDTNALSPTVAGLQPRRVEIYPPKQLPHFNDSDLPIVRITIFGAHSTGGHDIPWLGLDVVCAHSGGDYQPHRLRSETPLRYWRYRKIADDVYEFF